MLNCYGETERREKKRSIPDFFRHPGANPVRRETVSVGVG